MMGRESIMVREGEHLVMGRESIMVREGEHYQHDENTVGDGAIVEMVL